MEFRNHPIIEGLRVNEDGTEIYYKDVLLRVFKNDHTRDTPTLKVNFINKAHSVARLVCETWNGLREHSEQRASKIDLLLGNHYSNLEWKEGATNGVGMFKQKLQQSDVETIIELLKGKSSKEIAEMYGVNQSTIYRIKQRNDKENQ
ncbi:helix-turn-helix domain-containing protein [Flavobacterium sp. LC2016-23]|uniref:helix-turn-helix domain-containing protein n=1 Tax=Flavobacterium sp. LC2016-23 TaxID=2666330 RepID=UPI0012B0051F|nr:helix-turn-helix domain-containing protein [Flavobacterium sp. LC2016-23]MRX40375.1 helix-turn-helix domain-containing protein [Flavobacterium sp. LC2016-23]